MQAHTLYITGFLTSLDFAKVDFAENLCNAASTVPYIEQQYYYINLNIVHELPNVMFHM